METSAQYTLQLRVVEPEAGDPRVRPELEVVAHPVAEGRSFLGRFQHWEPVMENICAWMNSSAFHRKAVQRTLTAGLPAFMIDRKTGRKHVFTAAEVAALNLTPQEAQTLADADLGNAA